MAQYDVIIIGAGPGGYVCAIRCAQLGMKTACVEGRETLGGTCLNVGCIPSKALLHATHSLHEAKHNFAKMGVKAASPKADWPTMLAYKNDVIGQNTTGIEFLFKKNGIDWLQGWGSIPEAGKVEVDGKVHETKNIVIATGSAAAPLPGAEIDEKLVVTSTGALELTKIPKSMTVIGAGAIGLEMGSVYARLGTDVTVIEYLDEIVSGMDAGIARAFRRILEKQGIRFVMGSAVQSVEKTRKRPTGAQVAYKSRKNGEETIIRADAVLVATGRKPHTDGLGLDALGVAMSPRGQVATDERWATNVAGIYAIGDCIDGPMLAHKAEDEGMAVAENLAGRYGHVNYEVIPAVVYTTPELASAGKTEEQLRDEGHSYKTGKFSFMGNGRAKAVFQSDGFVKLLADAETDRILGCHILGPGAGDLIHEICVAMEFGASAEDIALTCHAHPTFSEAVREAALACGDGPIHS